LLNLFQHLADMKEPAFYILTNVGNKILYAGATGKSLKQRIWEHKEGLIDGFSKRYNLNKLVYFEECDSVEQAFERERQVKNWHRQWKINLIEKMNPTWKDLYDNLN